MKAAAEAFLEAGGLATYAGRMRLKHHADSHVVLDDPHQPTKCLLFDGAYCMAYGFTLDEILVQARAFGHRHLVFAGVDAAYYATACARGMPVLWRNACDFFVRATPIPAHVELPVGFQLDRIRLEDATEIDAYHPYRNPASLREIQEAILQRNSVALRTEEGELVAWELIQVDGTMGYLHVKGAFRRRGFAWLLGDVLARLQVESGAIPCARVLQGNAASQRLVSRRMRRVSTVDWFALAF